MSALQALEVAVTETLQSSPEIQQAFGVPARILNGETGRAAFPFIRIARHEIRQDGALEDHRLSLEVYSRAGGRTEANRLIALIADTLRAGPVTLEGHNLVLMFPVFSDVFLRADATTFRGLLRVRAVTEELG